MNITCLAKVIVDDSMRTMLGKSGFNGRISGSTTVQTKMGPIVPNEFKDISKIREGDKERTGSVHSAVRSLSRLFPYKL